MLRGCQKRIYYMKNPGGKYFDEAYLILKRDVPENRSKAPSPDLAAEADRIVRDACSYFAQPAKSAVIGRAAAFALGAVSSSVLIGTVALIVGLA